MQVVFKMNDMKKLLQEFKKNMLQERSESTIHQDAVDVLKYFVTEFQPEPNTPEAKIISQIQEIENFGTQLNRSSGLVTGTPEEDVIAGRKISNTHVHDYIENLLFKIGLDKENISGFKAFLEQKVEEPEEITQARLDLQKKEAGEEDSEEDSDEDEEERIKVQAAKQTAIGRAKRQQPKSTVISPEDSEITRRRAAAQGNKTQR